MIDEDIDEKVKAYFDKHNFDFSLSLKNNKDMSLEKKEFIHSSKID